MVHRARMKAIDVLREFGWGVQEGRKKRALYKAVCLSSISRVRLYLAARKNGVSRQLLRGWVKSWIISQTCRGCGEEVHANNFSIWHTYWQALWAPCHEGCRDVGMKEESYECQCIDADCNDCRHFQRGVTVPHDAETNKNAFLPLIGGVKGNCLKRSENVVANPKRASCNECFEHRRSPILDS
jgi:hypothetical protein